MERMRRGKEIGFQGRTYSLKTINIEHVFPWYSQKYTAGKTNFDFPNKMHTNLKILSYLNFCGQRLTFLVLHPVEII